MSVRVAVLLAMIVAGVYLEWIFSPVLELGFSILAEILLTLSYLLRIGAIVGFSLLKGSGRAIGIVGLVGFACAVVSIAVLYSIPYAYPVVLGFLVGMGVVLGCSVMLMMLGIRSVRVKLWRPRRKGATKSF